MRVYNVLGYFACGGRISWDNLFVGVEYARVFYLWV